MLFAHVAGTLPARISETFPPREILIRTDGRIRRVVIDTRSQAAAALGAFVVLCWIVVSSVGFLTDQGRLIVMSVQVHRANVAAARAKLEMEQAKSAADIAVEQARLQAQQTQRIAKAEVEGARATAASQVESAHAAAAAEVSRVRADATATIEQAQLAARREVEHARVAVAQMKSESRNLLAELGQDDETLTMLVRAIALGESAAASRRGADSVQSYEIARIADYIGGASAGLLGRQALRQRAGTLVRAYREAVDLNHSFTSEIAALSAQLQLVESEKLRIAQAMDGVSHRLRDTRETLERTDDHSAMLEGSVVSLRRQIEVAERLQVDTLADARRMEAELAAWRQHRKGGDRIVGPATAKLVEYPLQRLWAGHEPEDALVLAVMKQESGFRIDAVSGAGAQGLMQIMPDTAAHVAGKLKLDYQPAKLIHEPDFNITIGRAYLDQLLRLFNGSYVLAIAAYNAGPARVVDWIAQFGDPRENGVDTREWISNIPVQETRLYVRRVMKTLDVYRDRLTAAPPRQCSDMHLEKAFSVMQ